MLPESMPANTTPTAMPSGMLCSVTARTSIVVFFREVFGPSASCVPRCRCGITRSITSKNAMPKSMPVAAGTNANRPIPAAISIDGIKSDQTDAATMTPDAKPSSPFCSSSLSLSFKKNTHAEPSVVPTSGIINPQKTVILPLISLFSYILQRISSVLPMLRRTSSKPCQGYRATYRAL